MDNPLAEAHTPMSKEALDDLKFRVSGLLVLKGDTPEVQDYFNQMAEDVTRVVMECLQLRELVKLDVQIDALALARERAKVVACNDLVAAVQGDYARTRAFVAAQAGRNLRGATAEQLLGQLDESLSR